MWSRPCASCGAKRKTGRLKTARSPLCMATAAFSPPTAPSFSGGIDMTMKPVPVANPDTAPFWEACNEERFLIQECNACGKTQFYPRALCKHCNSHDLKWREASGRGKVKTFTVVNHAPSPAFKEDRSEERRVEKEHSAG